MLAVTRLVELIIPAFLPHEVLLHQVFEAHAVDEMVERPPCREVPNDQHALPAPAEWQITQEAADSPNGLFPALAARVFEVPLALTVDLRRWRTTK